MDFVSDALADGRRFRSLTIVDHFSRESRCDRGRSIVDRTARRRGASSSDTVLDDVRGGSPWTTDRNSSRRCSINGHTGIKVQLDFIRPGKAGRKRIHRKLQRTFPTGVLERQLVYKPRRRTEQRSKRGEQEYNARRPHSALGGLSPQEFLRAQTTDSSTESTEILTL